MLQNGRQGYRSSTTNSKELAVYAYPADEEPPEDDDELERELLEPFKEALDDGDNVWVESRAPVA